MVNDVLHGERIVDETAVRMWLDRASARSWRRGSLEFPKSAIVPILIKYAASSPQFFLKST